MPVTRNIPDCKRQTFPQGTDAFQAAQGLHRIVIKKGKRKGSLSKELQKHTNQSEVYKQKNPRGVDHSGDSD